MAALEATESAELERRALLYRGGLPRQPPEGRIAVVVDDGIATGSTARAGAPGPLLAVLLTTALVVAFGLSSHQDDQPGRADGGDK